MMWSSAYNRVYGLCWCILWEVVLNGGLPVSCFIVGYYAEAGDVTARLIGGAVQRGGAEAPPS